MSEDCKHDFVEDDNWEARCTICDKTAQEIVEKAEAERDRLVKQLKWAAGTLKIEAGLTAMTEDEVLAMIEREAEKTKKETILDRVNKKMCDGKPIFGGDISFTEDE